jgi:hypothetical protein
LEEDMPPGLDAKFAQIDVRNRESEIWRKFEGVEGL